nr:putative reverse transcriptase domain-containing protein [Tanacetum cinerariifolium]
MSTAYHPKIDDQSERTIQTLEDMDRQKSYADRKRNSMEFEFGDRVMLKALPWKGVVRFGKRGKLNLRYVRPFKVLAKVGDVAYKMELPQEFSRRSRIPLIKFAETLGEVLSSPGNVKIRSKRIPTPFHKPSFVIHYKVLSFKDKALLMGGDCNIS